jgi:hypothetical protein
VTPRRSGDYVKRRNLMLLAVAYSASIGGTGVITGTPSNLIILEVKIVKAFSFYLVSYSVFGQDLLVYYSLVSWAIQNRFSKLTLWW